MTISKRSEKRRKQEAEYSKLRKIYLHTHPTCERCGFHSQEIHHKKSRSGEHLLDESNFMAVCRNCHEYIETNSKESLEKGWKLLRSA
ncbi:MAG TPA: HNH endonuclease signature motif containing protein, partial [Ignavibacteriaceae bacterium]